MLDFCRVSNRGILFLWQWYFWLDLEHIDTNNWTKIQREIPQNHHKGETRRDPVA